MRCYTLADRTTRYQEALNWIDRARVAEPGNAAIIDSYGWVLFLLGKPREALDQLRHARPAERCRHRQSPRSGAVGAGPEGRGAQVFRGSAPDRSGQSSLQRAMQEVGA